MYWYHIQVSHCDGVPNRSIWVALGAMPQVVTVHDRVAVVGPPVGLVVVEHMPSLFVQWIELLASKCLGFSLLRITELMSSHLPGLSGSISDLGCTRASTKRRFPMPQLYLLQWPLSNPVSCCPPLPESVTMSSSSC